MRPGHSTGWGAGEGSWLQAVPASPVAPGGAPRGIRQMCSSALSSSQHSAGTHTPLPSMDILWWSMCLEASPRTGWEWAERMGAWECASCRCKFWKYIIPYDKVWRRNAWFSLIVSYILFLWELRRMFSYLACFLCSLQFICQSDPPKESELALIVRQMKGGSVTRKRAGRSKA